MVELDMVMKEILFEQVVGLILWGNLSICNSFSLPKERAQYTVNLCSKHVTVHYPLSEQNNNKEPSYQLTVI